MPPIEDLENPINRYASQVFSVDMYQLGTYSMEKNNRVYISYKDLSPNLVNALVATEDERFYNHSGVDPKALMRAILNLGKAGGASTISQQLAKQLYTEHPAKTMLERLLQKPVEWVIAVQLERYYTKDEIINLYLNKFDFLYNAVGIQSACRIYFGKSPSEVSAEEAALLVGMCKNPSLYNPIRRPEKTVLRRNTVFAQMRKNGYITKAECDSLSKLPLITRFRRADHKEGIAPYFREYLRMTLTAKKPEMKNYRGWQKQKFSEDSLAWETNPIYGWCNKKHKSDGSAYNVYTDGLKIYTTIDSRMQRYAEDALDRHLASLQDAFFKEKRGSKTAPFSRNLTKDEVNEIIERSIRQSERYNNFLREGLGEAAIKKQFDTPTEMTLFSWKGIKDTVLTPRDSIYYMKSFLRSGFMAMDPRTGAVRAYVGGANYHYFQYDMVSTGKRQVGSTIKPYLYSLAMESGFTPCNEMLHVPQTLLDANGLPWTPDNASQKRVGEMVSVRWGLQNSDNWVTAWLMKQLNPQVFANLLHSFGLKGHIDAVVSLCLGPCEASVAEMVSAYSAFANRGIRIEPVYVARIEDRVGNILYQSSPRMQEVISEEAAYRMLGMLREVIDGGTGNRMRRIYGMNVPLGGKTGTTQNHSDGWFMCFSPSIVAGAWVGGEDRDIHFDRMHEGQGAAMALPVVGDFFRRIYSDNELGYSETEQFSVSQKFSDPCISYRESTESVISGNSEEIDELFR
ncbi:MAG: transglycosylase domain-containing protein [Dysgonamonadaceae bacterium]|nr:transglycosylase domain-containing protein [Dysgonamonadaceae bacterium]